MGKELTMSHHLTYGKSDHVVAIELASPEDGPAASEMAREFADLCEQIAWDNDARVVLVSYDGTGHLGVPADNLHSSVAIPPSFAETAGSLKQPVIAAVRGDGIGPGLELALACDIRIGTEGACFGLPAVREGLVPCSGGTQRLPRLIGQGKALEMILTGEKIDAGEALRIGLINRIVASGELTSAATKLAAEIALKSPLAVAYVKEALHKGMDLTLEQGMRMELDLYLLLFTTGDRVEGIGAFKEKRMPQFEGR